MRANLNWHVHKVSGAQEALVYLEAGSLPDIIMLDMVMPGMNGLEFLEAFNQLSPPGKDKIIIIGLTLTGNVDQFQAALEYGAKVILAKPLRLDELMNAVGSES